MMSAIYITMKRNDNIKKVEAMINNIALHNETQVIDGYFYDVFYSGSGSFIGKAFKSHSFQPGLCQVKLDTPTPDLFVAVVGTPNCVLVKNFIAR